MTSVPLQQSDSSSCIYDPRTDAKQYIDRKWTPIPVTFRSKRPTINDWQKLRIAPEEVGELFGTSPLNIGVVLGDASSGLVDIDIDTDAALALAPHLLPPTRCIFGRKSRPSSHWLYTVLSPEGKVAFVAKDVGTIVEVRGNGHQTVFPPSIHQSGEPIAFEIAEEPGPSTWAELVTAALSLAIGTSLLKHWDENRRHDLALCVAGCLAKAGWEKKEVEKLILTVATAAHDREVEDRINTVETTFERLARGEPISAFSGLADHIGKRVGRDDLQMVGRGPGKAEHHHRRPLPK